VTLLGFGARFPVPSPFVNPRLSLWAVQHEDSPVD